VGFEFGRNRFLSVSETSWRRCHGSALAAIRQW
jgi:hypothetical protein